MINEADARAWIDAYAEAWVTRNSDRVVKIFAADAVFRERPFQPVRHGIEAIRTYWESLVTEGQTDVHFQLEQLAVSGDLGFFHWSAHFTWRPSNGIVELDGMSRVGFSAESRDGLRLASGFESWVDTRHR